MYNEIEWRREKQKVGMKDGTGDLKIVFREEKGTILPVIDPTLLAMTHQSPVLASLKCSLLYIFSLSFFLCLSFN